MISYIFWLFLFLFVFRTQAQAFAVCPVCVIAIGAGVGLSRWLGIDDTISGLWIGALILAMGLWLNDFLTKRKISFPGQAVIVTLLFYLMVIVPLYWSKIIGHPLNTRWGIDKLVLGIFMGSLVLLAGLSIDQLLRKKNKGKVMIAYQKVIIPVSLLLAGSILIYAFFK